MTPEQKARQEIDIKLQQAGWSVQDYNTFNPSASAGIAVREYPTDSGNADYVLFINRKPAGIIEAKKEGHTLSQVHEQTTRYATSKLNKERFYIIDAVGVFKTVKVDYPVVDKKPTVPLKDLMKMVVLEPDEENLTSLSSRLTRLDKQIDEADREAKDLSGYRYRQSR